MHTSTSSSLVIVQKYILLATGTPSSFAMRESVFVMYEQTDGQNQVAGLIDTFMADLAADHHNGVNGVIQDIAYNGFGLDMANHDVDQLKADLGSQGINSWSKLFAYAAIELEGELSSILDNRSEAANLFTDMLAELNSDSDYNGSQFTFAAREWLLSIGSTDESFAMGTGAIRDLIDSFRNGRDYTPPELTFSIPLDGATDFQTDGFIVFEFNEPIIFDEGVVVISNGDDIRTIDVQEDSDLISIDGNFIIIDPGADLVANTVYNISFEGGYDHEHQDEHEHREEHDHKDKHGHKDKHDHEDKHGHKDKHNHRDEHEHRDEHDHRDEHEHDHGDERGGIITDLAGNAYEGPMVFQFTTIAAVDPFLIDSVPLAEEAGFQIDGDITLVFNEMVTTGIGDIVISNSEDAADTRVIAVEDASQVIFDGNNVIIDPVFDLVPNAVYNIQLASGVIIDSAGNPYAGISDPTALSFTTIVSDIADPQLIGSNPVDDAVNFQVGSNITLSFDETVVAGAGDVVITNSIDAADTRTISVADATQVTFDGSNVIINPTLDLQPDADYNIQLASGVIVDLDGNAYAGISDPTMLNFTVTNADVADPILISSDPVDDAVDFLLDSNITLSFDEVVVAGAGDIVITNSVDPADTRTISVADATQVTFDGSNVIINPILDLQLGAAYDIQLADGVIVDLVGNAYAGISDEVTLNFSTVVV